MLKWFSFRLLAVDGSEINLPSSQELINDFGVHHINSIGTEIPQARVSFLCDVLNHLTLDAQIESFKVGEQTMFENHLNCIGKADILTADANYGHFRILKQISKTGSQFCVRMNKSSNFIKDFLKSGETDTVLDWNPSVHTINNCKVHNVEPTPMKIRLIRIELSKEITEVLAVSLLDSDKYAYSDFKELYDKRWGVEEEIKKYMQRLMIELFSSKKTNGVLQDFYANIFVLNVVSLIAMPVQEQIAKDDKEKQRKHNYQTNWTAVISDVRQRTILFFIRGIKQIENLIRSIQQSCRKIIEPIRLGRQFPRDKRKKGSRQKAFMNYKPI